MICSDIFGKNRQQTYVNVGNVEGSPIRKHLVEGNHEDKNKRKIISVNDISRVTTRKLDGDMADNNSRKSKNVSKKDIKQRNGAGIKRTQFKLAGNTRMIHENVKEDVIFY